MGIVLLRREVAMYSSQQWQLYKNR